MAYLIDGLDPSYITVSRDVRAPDRSYIEVVHQGHVMRRLIVPDAYAPERIVGIMRHWARLGHAGYCALMQAEDALFQGIRP